MINKKTKNRVFTSYPHRKPEIMETYSVNFHNFRLLVGDESEMRKNGYALSKDDITVVLF